jgi:hypothetical protein
VKVVFKIVLMLKKPYNENMNNLFTEKWSHYFSNENRASTLALINSNPTLLNQSNGNCVLTEFLMDKQEHEFLQKFAKYIDLSLPASNGMNLLGYLSNSKLPNTLKIILNHQPQVLNQCGPNGVYPVEYLINNQQFEILQKFISNIDTMLPSSKGTNILTCMIEDEMPTTLKMLFQNNPPLLNSKAPNGVYALEYLMKHKYYDLMQSFAKHLDVTLPASNGMSLLGIMIKEEMTNTILAVLNHHPGAINKSGPNGVSPVEYMIQHKFYNTMQKYAQHIDLSQPCSTGGILLNLMVASQMPTTLNMILKHHPELVQSPPVLKNIKPEAMEQPPKIVAPIEAPQPEKVLSKYQKLL